MISFENKDSLIIISYSTDRDNKWVFDKFDNGDSYAFNKVYNLSSENIYKTEKKIEKGVALKARK